MLSTDASPSQRVPLDLELLLDGPDARARPNLLQRRERRQEDRRGEPEPLPGLRVGKHYPSATLQIRKAGEGPMLYMEYRLENVRISSVSVSHSAGHDEPVEEVTLSYGKIVWTYTPADARRQGGGVEKKWNLEANQEG